LTGKGEKAEVQMFSPLSQARFLTSCKQAEKNSEEIHLTNYAEPVLLSPLTKRLNNLGGREGQIEIWAEQCLWSNKSYSTNAKAVTDEPELLQRLH